MPRWITGSSSVRSGRHRFFVLTLLSMVFTGQEWPNSEAHTPEDQGAMDLAATDQHSAESMTMTNAFGYQKNLHSHLFKASLSQQQEVSGYGADGKGDFRTNEHTW